MSRFSFPPVAARLRLLFFAMTAILYCGCHKNTGTRDAAVKKGARHLGLHLSTAVNSTYTDSYQQVRTAGIDCIPFTLQWTAIEQNGRYDSAGLLEALNGFYAGQPVSLSVCISPFAANRRDMPADLLSTAFDDPGMIARFNKLLDSIHSKLGAVNLRYLVLGNEADLYLSGHPGEWTAFSNFCRATRLYAKNLWGDQLKIGAETTLGSAIGNARPEIQSLLVSMDILCLTYYPLRNDFTMEPSGQAVADFNTLFSLYPSAPVLLQECGYATGALCGGSDTAQVNFVKTVFGLWDTRAEQISYIAFLWLNDLSTGQSLEVTSDYGLSATAAAPAFTDYIRTLGLCDSTGKAKPGFSVLQQEASKRGWSN